MSKGIKTHIINFTIIPTSDDKSIVFADNSDYYKIPESPILEIVLPGFNKVFTVNIDPSKINVLNSNLIGLTSVLKTENLVSLQDGIYTLTYKICPYQYFNVTKYFLKTDQIEKDLAKIFNKVKCDSSIVEHFEFKKQVMDIMVLLESAKACVNNGFLDRGTKDFKLAQNKVKKLINKEI
jgi:hypothetical protein